jgi:LPXTG-motif cell wall-anchored protein
MEGKQDLKEELMVRRGLVTVVGGSVIVMAIATVYCWVTGERTISYVLAGIMLLVLGLFIILFKKSNMDYKQNLYYAFGHIAYALAGADGDIQKEEKEKLHRIITNGVKGHGQDLNYADIIFQVLKKDKEPFETAYSWGLKEIKLSSQYLSEKIKQDFILILHQVAEAFPPTTLDEEKLIDRFKKDLSGIKGDPVFTGEPKK